MVRIHARQRSPRLLSLHAEFLPEQRFQLIHGHLESIMDRSPFGSRQSLGTALRKRAVRIPPSCSVNQLFNPDDEPSGFLDHFQDRAFSGLPGFQTQKLAAVEMPATVWTLRVDLTPALPVCGTRLVKKFASRFPLHFQSLGGESACRVTLLQHNRVKKNPVATHAARGAETGCGGREFSGHSAINHHWPTKAKGKNLIPHSVRDRGPSQPTRLQENRKLQIKISPFQSTITQFCMLQAIYGGLRSRLSQKHILQPIAEKVAQFSKILLTELRITTIYATSLIKFFL